MLRGVKPRSLDKFSHKTPLGVNDGKRPTNFSGKNGKPNKNWIWRYYCSQIYDVHFSFLSKYQVLLRISRLHQKGNIEIHHYVALKNHPFGSIILIQLANVTKSTYIYCKFVLTGWTSPFFSRPSVIAILRTANPAESFSAGPHRCSASVGLSSATQDASLHKDDMTFLGSGIFIFIFLLRGGASQ